MTWQNISMVAVGVLLLGLLADFAVGTFLRGLPLRDQVRHFSTADGLAYAAALVLFAAMPAIVHALGSRR